MTTWTSISNASVGVGGIPSSTTMTALRDNPAAMAEAATGAPAISAGWVPVDKLTVGDGKTGLIYDYASNGTVASVVTPNFEDGWEYRVVAHGLNSSNTGTVRLNLNGYRETSGDYRRLIYSPDAGGSSAFGYDITIMMPRIVKNMFLVQGIAYGSTTVFINYDTTSYIGLTPEKMLKAQVVFTAGSIAGGKVWLFRRRDYSSLS